MFIHEVCKALAKAEIPYAIVGGYAVALHGALRGTIDVDVIVNYDLKIGHSKTVKTRLGNIQILTIKDLIKMKKLSGRPQDLEDVQALEKLL